MANNTPNSNSNTSVASNDKLMQMFFDAFISKLTDIDKNLVEEGRLRKANFTKKEIDEIKKAVTYIAKEASASSASSKEIKKLINISGKQSAAIEKQIKKFTSLMSDSVRNRTTKVFTAQSAKGVSSDIDRLLKQRERRIINSAIGVDNKLQQKLKKLTLEISTAVDGLEDQHKELVVQKRRLKSIHTALTNSTRGITEATDQLSSDSEVSNNIARYYLNKSKLLKRENSKLLKRAWEDTYPDRDRRKKKTPSGDEDKTTLNNKDAENRQKEDSFIKRLIHGLEQSKLAQDVGKDLKNLLIYMALSKVFNPNTKNSTKFAAGTVAAGALTAPIWAPRVGGKLISNIASDVKGVTSNPLLTKGEKAASLAMGVGPKTRGMLGAGGRLLGGIGTVFSGIDTVDRAKRGDKLGATLSGISTATGAAAIGATASGVGAPAGATLEAISLLTAGLNVLNDHTNILNKSVTGILNIFKPVSDFLAPVFKGIYKWLLDLGKITKPGKSGGDAASAKWAELQDSKKHPFLSSATKAVATGARFAETLPGGGVVHKLKEGFQTWGNAAFNEKKGKAVLGQLKKGAVTSITDAKHAGYKIYAQAGNLNASYQNYKGRMYANQAGAVAFSKQHGISTANGKGMGSYLANTKGNYGAYEKIGGKNVRVAGFTNDTAWAKTGTNALLQTLIAKYPVLKGMTISGGLATGANKAHGKGSVHFGGRALDTNAISPAQVAALKDAVKIGLLARYIHESQGVSHIEFADSAYKALSKANQAINKAPTVQKKVSAKVAPKQQKIEVTGSVAMADPTGIQGANNMVQSLNYGGVQV